LVAVRLPRAAYAPLLPYQRLQTLSCWTQLGNQAYNAQCALYGTEILLYALSLNANTATATTYVLNLINLVNPDIAQICPPGSFFEVRLIDSIARDVVLQSSVLVAPSLPPCLKFTNTLYGVDVRGASVLMAGISYEYTLTISRAANGLSFTPSASVLGIQFTPQRIDFNDFSAGTTATFRVQVLPSVQPGQYTLRFDKSEPSPEQYLAVVPFTVTVLAIGGSSSGTSDDSSSPSVLQSTPTVTVKDVQVDTIGYPINVPVVLSAPAANLMYLTISKTGDVNDVLDVTPSRVLIDAGVTLVYF
jgi:hypothetical protein